MITCYEAKLRAYAKTTTYNNVCVGSMVNRKNCIKYPFISLYDVEPDICINQTDAQGEILHRQ